MTPEVQVTIKRLAHLIATAPGAVAELLARYDCEVPASPETLAAMYAVKGEPYADDVFILLAQVENGDEGRYANAAGPATSQPVGEQRTTLGRGLQAVANWLRTAGIMQASGNAGGVDYDATNDPTLVGVPAPRIMGLSEPVFYLGVLALLLGVVALLIHHSKKK